MSCGSTAWVAVPQRRLIGRRPETQNRRDAGGSALPGIGAEPSPAPELPHVFESPGLLRREGTIRTFWLSPGRRRRSWWSLVKPMQARNFKDLKGVTGRYTFLIRSPF